MARVIREKARYGLVLDQDDDCLYRLLVDGEVTFASKVAAAVEIQFDETLAERSTKVRETQRREQGYFQVEGVLAQAAQSKAAGRNAGRSRGKGG